MESNIKALIKKQIMKNFILFLFSTFLFTNIQSQNVLLDEEIKDETPPSTYGPNQKKYAHFYIAYGVPVGPSESDSVAVNTFRSFEYIIGYRYKLKISSFYAIGFDLNFNSKVYNVKQDSFKLFPNKTIHNKEKLQMRSLGIDIYNRFNFGKRGDILGNYLDVGAYLDWTPNPTYITYDKYSIVNAVGASNTRQLHKGLVYVNPINYGLLGRIGFGKFLIYGSYRLSDIFYKQFIYTEFPRIIAGIQMGLIK